MDQSKETKQLEWQHVESHHTLSNSLIVGAKASSIEHKLHVWLDLKQESPVDMWTHIFCNQSLNMKNIVAVGCNMDYTLAQYKPETFENMAYTCPIQKLVNDLGCPKRWVLPHLQLDPIISLNYFSSCTFPLFWQHFGTFFWNSLSPSLEPSSVF